jgi:hypothetical protein
LEGDVILGSSVAQPLAGPFLAACALLLVAGVGKVMRPDPARLAARAAGIRVPRVGIVAFGLLEVAIGGTGAVGGGFGAFGVAACYLLLGFVAVRLLQRAPATPCACLGSSTAVVTRTHVAVDLAAALVAIGAASGGSPWSRLSGHWVSGAVFMVLVATCAKLAALALETLPDVSAAAKEGAT